MDNTPRGDASRVLIVELLIAHLRATAIKESRECSAIVVTSGAELETSLVIPRDFISSYLSVHFFSLCILGDPVLVKGPFNAVALFLSAGYHSHLIRDAESGLCAWRERNI